LLLYAIERVKTQVIFDLDPYESRREALPGSRLLKVLVFYQMLKDPSQRGLVRKPVTANGLCCLLIARRGQVFLFISQLSFYQWLRRTLRN